ncbi:MAG: hypothetical protein P8P29_00220 [Flavobacteriaceae bacterium]|nr:hypothetical protein [Flavobacteriaceae bacterium]
MKDFDESASFKRIQTSLKKIKLQLGQLERHNRAAARAAEANCAYKWQQKVGVLHAEATEDLLKFFPSAFEDGMVITPKGGGSR